ncbi:MAG: FkbM family methyltransferase [Rhodospirillales bacterium]
MISLPTSLKLCIPGYRARWKRRSQCLLDHFNEHAPRLTFGEEDGVPFLANEEKGLKLYGFWNDPKSDGHYRLIRPYIPAAVPESHFRLFKDYVNRYIYPHMRPDLDVVGYTPDQMAGMHGQHKDSIQNLPAAHRQELIDAFTPRAGDVIINCGAFIGFGDIRLAESVTRGRIIAVEASRECFEFLQRNLDASGASVVTPIHRAVWNTITTMELESDFAQANTLVGEVHKGRYTQEVETITIDRIVGDHGLKKLDMISLTLNGAEIEALDGATNALQTFKPRVRLAGWYTRDGKRIADHVRPVLERFGYRVFVGPRGNVLALADRNE